MPSFPQNNPHPFPQVAWTVCLAGLGNIGSALALLLARLPFVGRLIVVDPDCYDESNLASQGIGVEDIGCPKAEAVARALRRMLPGFPVLARNSGLEALPLGDLRSCALMISCLDSRRARMHANEAGWLAGVPVLDTAVGPDHDTVRAVFVDPRVADSPCLECGFTSEDYRLAGSIAACSSPEEAAHPTGAPAALGALAAGMAALLVKRMQAGCGPVPGREAFLCDDGEGGFQSLGSILPRNPGCRFHHVSLPPVESEVALGAVVGGLADSVELPGMGFESGLICPRCGKALSADVVRVGHRKSLDCACGGRLRATVRAEQLPAAARQATLAALGLEPGDILLLDGRSARVVPGV